MVGANTSKKAESEQRKTKTSHMKKQPVTEVTRDTPTSCQKCLNGGWLYEDSDEELRCMYCGWNADAKLIEVTTQEKPHDTEN